MAWQFNPYAIPMFVSSIFLLLFAAIALRRTISLPVNLFMAFVISVAGLNFAYGMELLSADLPAMMIWLRVQYFFRYIPTLWLFFVLAYIGQAQWVRPRYLIPFFAVPAVWAIMAWTNDAHLLNWRTTGVEMVQGMAMFTRTYGPGFYVGLAYDYAIAAGAAVIMSVSILRSPTIYREQIVYLIVGLVPPLIGSILTTFNLTPVPHLDLLPFGYALMCLPLGWSLFRHHLLDIRPRAYSQVIQSMPDAVLVLDELRRVIHANPAATALVNHRSATDITGLALADIFPDASLPAMLDNLAPGAELCLPIPGGGPRYVEPRISNLTDHAGLVRGYVIVLRDVTERKHAQETISHYAAELETRNRELDAFSYTVAHDLKSPVSNVIGFGLLLLDAGDDRLDSDFARKNLNRVVQAGQKMNDMIDGLLLLAQLRNAETVLEVLDMQVVARAAVERYQLDLDRRGVHVEIAEQLPPVCGHALWLEEVFANLISNALKYIGHDNPAPAIQIQGFDQGGITRFEVQDNGIGISITDREKLFEMFSRFHRNEAAGLGLGLSIVLHIIEKLGGSVGVESEPGVGSIFWFVLPSQPAAEITVTDQVMMH